MLSGAGERAQAAVSPQPYLDPTFEPYLFQLLLDLKWQDRGGLCTACAGQPLPPGWSEPEVFEMQVAAVTMPPLKSVGTFVLPSLAPGPGGTAGTPFDKGWKITRNGDSRWMHLSGAIGSYDPATNNGLAATVTGASWSYQLMDSGGFGFPTTAVWALTVSVKDNATGTILTSSIPFNCNSTGQPTNACGVSSPATTANRQLLYETIRDWNGGGTQVDSTDCYNSGNAPSPPPPNGTGTTCRIGRYMTEHQMNVALIHAASQPFTTQVADYTTTVANPTSPNNTVLTAGRNAITNGTVGMRLMMNCALDPANWSCPTNSGGAGGGTGGGTTGGTITVPDCRNRTVSYCTNLLTSLGFTGPVSSVSLTAAQAVASVNPGNVTATTPTAGTVVDKSFTAGIQITHNPSDAVIRLPRPGVNEACDAYAHRVLSLGLLTLPTCTVHVGLDVEGIGPGAVTQAAFSVPLGSYDGLGCNSVSNLVDAQDIFVQALSWSPVGCTQVDAGTTVRLEMNSAAADPGPCLDPAACTTPAPPPGGAGCDGYLTASVKLDALNGHALMGKFPFSAFAYIGNITDDFNGQTGAPNVVLDMPGVSGDKIAVPLDLANADPMMQIIRPAMALMLTAVFIWALATAFMGLGSLGGGNED